jgi:hypothetical protein
VERSNLPAQLQFNDAIKKNRREKFQKMLTTKRSHFSIPWPIPPPPSQAEVDYGVFEVYERADPLKWAARAHWPCLTPPQSVEFSPYFLSPQTEPPFRPTSDLSTEEVSNG